ncbi:MAG: M28 family peptidase [Lachnospiraceae bacterium]|nr:M28 family peptidase [Lachnospiraceae bacterium]
MKNNRRSLLFACFILAMMLAGPLCLSASADNDAYGEAAWQYLQVIDQNFPSRITNVAVTEDFGPKKAAGAWIRSTLEGFGYNVTETTHMAGPNECITYRVTKPGNSPKKLVIGAHYDCVATKGVEDNGTGVSLLLELAARFINTETPLTLEFCFWDAEEYLASFSADQYVQEAAASGKAGDILLYVNLDSIGSGDHLYVYGGVYQEKNLTAVWGLNLADALAKRLGVPVYHLPEEVSSLQKSGYQPPARTANSDQEPFARNGIPYIYFEASDWSKLDDQHPQLLTTADPRIVSVNGGQLVHTSEYEDLAVLESLFPGRIQTHLRELGLLVSTMIRETGEETPALYRDGIPEEETSTENGSDESDESEETDESDETEETDESDGSGKTEETDEPDEASDDSDESEKSDGSGKSDNADESDGADNTDDPDNADTTDDPSAEETTQQAAPSESDGPSEYSDGSEGKSSSTEEKEPEKLTFFSYFERMPQYIRIILASGAASFILILLMEKGIRKKNLKQHSNQNANQNSK